MFGFESFDVLRRGRGVNLVLVALFIGIPVAIVAAQAMPQGKDGGSETQSSPPESSASGPKIEAIDSKYQFGEVWAGFKVKHTFEIRNTGDSMLDITKVKPGCGCTLAGQYDRKIPPGGVGKIPISLNTSRLRSKVTKTITVTSNDPNQPSFKLFLKGTVKPTFVMKPPRGLSFGRIKPGQALDGKVTLTNQTGQPVKLSLSKSKSGVFTGELIEKTPGQLYELLVRAEGPYRQNVNSGKFKITTDMLEKVTLQVNVSCVLPQNVEVSPRSLVIRPSSRPVTKKVTVKFNSKEPFKVLSAEVNDPAITVTVGSRIGGRQIISLELPAGYVPPAKGRTLSIKTDDPKAPQQFVKISTKPAMTLTGKPVPDATFVTAGGENIATTSEGQVTLLKFYASWCGYCKKALPKINQMSKDLADKPIRFVGISQDSIVEFGASPSNKRARTKEQLVKQWQDMGLGFTQAFDPDGAGRKKFKVQSFPTMFLVGQSGRVEKVYLGGGAVNDGSLKRDIETLLSGKSLAQQTTTPDDASRRLVAGKSN